MTVCTYSKSRSVLKPEKSVTLLQNTFSDNFPSSNISIFCYDNVTRYR